MEMAKQNTAIPSEEASAACVAGRYRLLERLDSGGTAEVWSAKDVLGGEDVAVKLLSAGTDAVRLRAEVSALRLLNLPGVSRLLDEGTSGGRPFLVMELVAGKPFPGALGWEGPKPWESLHQTAVALLEILARVHLRGVVHRDLKPDNVLVDKSGRPVVLDFGLSGGPAIGAGRGTEPTAVGTPAFAAPEQILGAPVDARADLYSYGAMLYEALSGSPPHAARLPDEFLQERLHAPAKPLSEVAHGVPPAVSDLVDRLLSREPADRPRSAVEVLATLRGEQIPTGDPELPWLGGDRGSDAATRVLLSGRPVDVVGPEGIGKTRLVRRILERLHARGSKTMQLQPGERPFESLDALVGSFDDDEDLDSLIEKTGQELVRLLEGGRVLVIDGVEQMDPWTQRVLERLVREGAPGALLRTSSVPRVARATSSLRLELQPMSAVELRPLFAGPDRVFHLREDAADELWRRTHGHPRALATEVSAWLRAGMVHGSGQTLSIGRTVLERLAVGLEILTPASSRELDFPSLPKHLNEALTWAVVAGAKCRASRMATAQGLPRWTIEAQWRELEEAGALRRLSDERAEALVLPPNWTQLDPVVRERMHDRLAAAIPPGEADRLLHLVSAGRFGDVTTEASVTARRLLTEGRLPEAEAAVTEGLSAVRHVQDAQSELRLLGDWLCIAFAEFSPQAVDRVRYEISRSPLRGRSAQELKRLDQLSRAALSTFRGGGAEALGELDRIGEFGELEIERWRLALCVLAARGASSGREKVVLEKIEQRWNDHPSKSLQASLHEWRGRLAYRQDRPLEAAEQFEQAAELAERVHAKLSGMLNGASALLEASAFSRARGLAERARGLAADCRHATFEVRAEWILRSAEYRQGRATQPDLELVDAVRQVGVSDQEALVCLNEAAVAWRGGHGAAGELARRAAELWATQGKLWGAGLARALECLVDPELVVSDSIRDLADRVAVGPDPSIAGQSLALLSRANVPLPERASRVAEALRRDTTREDREARREVLSIGEVLAELER